jgi:hypothetical protein
LRGVAEDARDAARHGKLCELEARKPPPPGRHDTTVTNHPQRLWISLWTGFRLNRQVALPKGFSFFRSNFERHPFHKKDQGLAKL